MPRTLSPAARIERSILSDFRKPLWRPFVRGIKQYKMIAPGDHIAVCISGGKDSMLLAKMMQLLQRHTDIPFETEFLVMDPGYNAENRQRIIDNAALMEIPIRIFDSSIFETTKIAERNPCYLCARMRRGFLYDRAQEMGCNKIALGHHFNDVVETTVMGMFYGAQLQAMLPKLHSRNFPGMELIRPMYCIHEEDICAWRDFNDLHFIACDCRLTEERDKSGDGIGNSKRAKPDGSAYRVGVQDPDDPNNSSPIGAFPVIDRSAVTSGPIGVVSVIDRSVVTSGIYERGLTIDGVRYHHILSPWTGLPSDSDLASATIIAESSMDADALATACIVLGSEKALQLTQENGYPALMILRDGTVMMNDLMKQWGYTSLR